MARSLADALVKRFQNMDAYTLEVGWVGESAKAPHPNGKGLSVGEVAHIVNFGNEHIPARPALRYTAIKRKKQISAVTAAAVRAVTDGRSSVERALNLVGTFVAAQVQEVIAQDKVPPPNAPSTIKAKGSSTPLIDTGVLRQAVTWRLVKKNG